MKAQRSAFTKKNIKSAFATTRIYLLHQHQVFDILQHLSTVPKSQQTLPTPTTTQHIQHLKLLAEKSNSLEEVKQICYQLAETAGTALADKAIAQETV